MAVIQIGPDPRFDGCPCRLQGVILFLFSPCRCGLFLQVQSLVMRVCKSGGVAFDPVGYVVLHGRIEIVGVPAAVVQQGSENLPCQHLSGIIARTARGFKGGPVHFGHDPPGNLLKLLLVVAHPCAEIQPGGRIVYDGYLLRVA